MEIRGLLAKPLESCNVVERERASLFLERKPFDVHDRDRGRTPAPNERMKALVEDISWKE